MKHVFLHLNILLRLFGNRGGGKGCPPWNIGGKRLVPLLRIRGLHLRRLPRHRLCALPWARSGDSCLPERRASACTRLPTLRETHTINRSATDCIAWTQVLEAFNEPDWVGWLPPPLRATAVHAVRMVPVRAQIAVGQVAPKVTFPRDGRVEFRRSRLGTPTASPCTGWQSDLGQPDALVRARCRRPPPRPALGLRVAQRESDGQLKFCSSWIARS